MNSEFRTWLHNIWLDNCNELRDYRQTPYTMREYFQKYKYWLKREFRHQQNQIISQEESNLAIDAVLDDKLDYKSSNLLSKNQNKLINTLKDNNEK